MRSRSSQSVLLRSAGSTDALTIRARPQTCSDFIGLRLCGIVEEPTWWAPKASSTSPISVRWRERISIPILSSVVATLARNMKYSAYRSREMTWFETSTGERCRISIIAACTSMPFGPRAACVPTAPVICPTATRGRSCSRRSICRPTSLAQMANLRPYVVGTPCCPCVRPTATSVIVSSALRIRYPEEFSQFCVNEIHSLGELEPGRRIEDVIGGGTVMHPPPRVAADLRDRLYDRHHVVADLFLDLLCTGKRCPGCVLCDLPCRIPGDHTLCCFRLRERCFDRDNAGKPVFLAPDGSHFRCASTGNRWGGLP